MSNEEAIYCLQQMDCDGCKFNNKCDGEYCDIARRIAIDALTAQIKVQEFINVRCKEVGFY